MEAPDTITCVECGAAAGRLTHLPPEDVLLPGDIVTYVCPECSQRFDIVLENDEQDEGD